MNTKHVPVIQVAGFKNSGKTTLIGLLVESLSRQGLKAAVIKHHGHGGVPDRVSGTDTDRHILSGALCSAAEGEGAWEVSITRDAAMNLEAMMALCRQLGADVIFLEGYKQAPYPKIVLLRNEADRKLHSLENVMACGGWEEPEAEKGHFSFSLERYASYEDELMRLLIGRCFNG